MSEIQSVVFNKNEWNLIEARKWLNKHNYLNDYLVDEKPFTYRFRQIEPSNFNRFVTKKLPNGIDLILGFK